MAYRPDTAGQFVGFTMLRRRDLKPAVGLGMAVHRRVNGGPWELCVGAVTESGEGGYLYEMTAADCPPGQTQLVMSHPDAMSCGVTILPFEPVSDSVEMVNQDVVGFTPGMPVAASVGPPGAVLAGAASPVYRAVGLAETAAAPTFAARVRLSGVFSQADWSAVVGTALLTPGAGYYLDVAFGTLTTFPGDAGGYISQRVGTALSTVAMDVDPTRPVLL